MLSALDVELLEDWSRRGMPLEVVVRGLQKAVETSMWDARPDTPTLRSLRSCRRAVESEFKKHQAFTLGKGQPTGNTQPFHLVKHQRLLKALSEWAGQNNTYEKTVSRLLSGPLSQPPESLEGLNRQEECVMAALIRALPFGQRIELLRQARILSQNTPALSWSARKMARRFHRSAVAKRQLSLPPFW